MKRTLKRELKAREIDIGEAIVKVAYECRYTSFFWSFKVRDHRSNTVM